MCKYYGRTYFVIGDRRPVKNLGFKMKPFRDSNGDKDVVVLAKEIEKRGNWEEYKYKGPLICGFCCNWNWMLGILRFINDCFPFIKSNTCWVCGGYYAKFVFKEEEHNDDT